MHGKYCNFMNFYCPVEFLETPNLFPCLRLFLTICVPIVLYGKKSLRNKIYKTYISINHERAQKDYSGCIFC